MQKNSSLKTQPCETRQRSALKSLMPVELFDGIAGSPNTFHYDIYAPQKIVGLCLAPVL